MVPSEARFRIKRTRMMIHKNLLFDNNSIV